jgi:protein SCO1/2
MKTKLLAVLSALVVLVVVCVGTREASAQRNRWGANYFPNTELITQDGKKVHFYDDLIKGKIVAITLIYTQCKDNCPLETARMRQVQKILGDRVGKDIFFYSISIDPEHDTPEVLKDYAEMYNVGPGWTFLTGKKADIEELGKKLGLYLPADFVGTRDGHTPSLMIGNEATGQWVRQNAGDNARFLAIQLEQLGGYNNITSAATTVSHKEAAKLNESFDKGRYLFGSNCGACHTIGNGDKVGPDLMGVANVRDPKWLKEMIEAPDVKLDSKDPIATALLQKYRVRMPNLRLIPEDVDAIVKFIKSQKPAAPQTSAAPQSSEKQQASLSTNK